MKRPLLYCASVGGAMKPKTYNGVWNNLQGIVLVHDFQRATAEAAMDLFRGADLSSISPFVPRIGTCPRK